MVKNMYLNAGRRIRELREKEGFTREQLAEIVGISEKHLYEIEVNGKGFSAKVLFDISQKLKSSADYILEGKKNSSFDIYSANKKKEISEILMKLYSVVLGEPEQ